MSPAAALAIAVALPFCAALALCTLPNHRRDLATLLAGATALAVIALLASAVPGVLEGAVPRIGWPWLPLPGAGFGFRADGLSLVFALLVAVIGALVILYARYYLDPQEPAARFHAFFMLFMGAMLGLVLAGNLLLLATFWELTSLASFLLIGFWAQRSDARRGARLALTITGAGGLALLGGVLLLGHIAGSYDLDVVLASGAAIRAHPAYLPMLLLVLLGAFAKSAQFPLHFWLPQAMAAPTPVSAYLHSATMVKAGVFLLARLHPAIAGTEAWFTIVTSVGLATLVVGAWSAIYQHDLKGLLAYSTISHLGLITLLLGLDTPLASVAAVFHLLNHATFKAALFMAAGIIDHECGTRDLRRINGLWQYMPVTATLAIVAAAAMAGVPLLNGFLSKEMFLAETLQIGSHGVARIVVPMVATLASALTVAYSSRFIHDVFWNGEPRGLPRTPHEPPFWMALPAGLLALLCLLVGALPNATIAGVLALAAAPVTGGRLPDYSLAIWHGFSLPLAMSAGALLVGAAFYVSLQRIYRLHEHVHLPRGGAQLFEAALQRLLALARRLVGELSAPHLQRQLALVAAAAALAIGLPLWLHGSLQPESGIVLRDGRPLEPGTSGPTGWPLPPLALLPWLLAVVGALGAVVWHRRRFTAMLFVGLAGLAASLVFALLSAPDVALTQLLVEMASVLLVMLALRRLPAGAPPDPARRRAWRDALLAGAVGLGVAALAYAVLVRPDPGSIAPWFLANAISGASGSNAVNVIIVDFRGLDTLGEIVVLGIAALVVLGVAAPTRGPAHMQQSPSSPGRPPAPAPALLDTVGPVLLPLAATVALWFFVRGHDAPGGGFIGGLVLALGLLVPWLGRDGRQPVAPLALDGRRWIGAGLAIAVLAGLGSFLAGHPFLTSHYFHADGPLPGGVSLASAVGFDFGVLLVVTGATVLALTTLGREGAH